MKLARPVRGPGSRRGHRSILLASILSVVVVLGSACSGADSSAREQAPSSQAEWLDVESLFAPGFGTVSFRAQAGPRLQARIYRATRFDPSTGPIWFVMHGASRDVERYVRIAGPVAERHDALAIVVHFDERNYPRSSDYTLGLEAKGWRGRDGWLEPDRTLYAEIERVFEAVVDTLGGQQPGYHLFGHSAGAQFTHRLLTFLPSPRVLTAVAANAGWYTLPIADDRREHAMPYGLSGSPVAPEDLRSFFATRFVVLLGADDTTTAATDDLVRGTPEAQAQGEHRLARGRHYFETAREAARTIGAPFAWRLAVVPHADHDAGRMIDSAAYFSFDAWEDPCAPSSAADAGAIVITEILADPPDGAAGDANGDGVRDPEADEFVEFANAGARPLCLGGWTLGDADRSDRHVFPLGTVLAPGAVLVVFGGGVPTGDFHGAQVQWSDSGLSLSNRGDVLTLRDATGSIVHRVSWGDCDGAPCADDHFDGELGIETSLERAPAPAAGWKVPPTRSAPRFSPGESRADLDRSN